MTRRILTTLTVVLLTGATGWAQTASPQPAPGQPAPQRPRAGAIVDTPSSGRIIDAPQATAPLPVPAQKSPAAAGNGATIERFEVVGNATVASDTIRVYLGIVPGDPFNREAIQKNFSNLWQTGLFDDIRIETEPGTTGIVVRAVVKERPRIGSVEYRGNKDLQTSKILEALEQEKIDLHVGNTIEQTLIRRAAEKIKSTYSEGGYEGVNVDTRLEDMPEPGEKKIVFVISEGIKAKVSRIDFTGNQRFSDRRLRSQMKQVKGNNLITWIRKKNLYIPSKLDEDLEHVKNFYQDHGYQDISFGEPQVITVGRNTKKPRVKLVIPVKEGGIYKFGAVSVEGNTVFTSEQVIGNWPLKSGETIRRKPIQGRLDSFDEAYRARGYIYAYVDPEYVKREGNIVDVHVKVFEGDQYRLGRLEFEGNSTTKDKVLRREIFLDEGSIMDMETFKASLYKLGQLGYFKVTENPDFKVNQESKSVDITVKGLEEGKNDIQFGGGYTEGGGFFLQTQFSTRNFLGEGESFGLSYQNGARVNYFSLSYSYPWFLDTPNSFGVSIFNTATTYPTSFGYQTRSQGGNVAYGYRIRRFDSFSLVYGYQKTRTHYELVESPDPNGNVPVSTIADARFTMSTIAPTYRYDSRDNPFDTFRGMRINAGLGFSGGVLGGTVNIAKPTIGITRFVKLSRRTAVSANIEGGMVIPLGKDCSYTYQERVDSGRELCVPESERFLVGGESSVRGFRLGSLGPQETLPGRALGPVGGYSYQAYNFEYITKLNEPLRLVLFADAGAGYAYKEALDFAKLRYTAGAELRIFLPVFQFPLRFIYAINPAKKANDRFESFQFTIGNTF